MKILTIAATPFFSDRGCHIRIYNGAKYLEKFGAQVKVCTYFAGENAGGLDVERIGNVRWYKRTAPGFSWGKFWLDIKLILLCRKIIRTYEPDIIHAHLYEGLGVGYIAKKLAFRNVSIVFDLQGDLDEEFRNYNRKNYIARRIFVWLSKIFINKCDRLVLSSPNAVSAVEKICMNNEKYVIIEDGIDLDLFRNPQDISAADKGKIEELKEWVQNKKVLVYIGGLSDGKGTKKLLEVFGKIARERTDWKLILAGFGENEREYQEYIEKNNLGSNVKMPGRLGYFAGPHLFSLADAAVDPKNGSAEGSVKLVSYMAAGLPVVCFENEFNRSKLGDNGYYMKEMEDLQGVISNIETGKRIRYENLVELSEEKEAKKLFDIFQSVIQK